MGLLAVMGGALAFALSCSAQPVGIKSEGDKLVFWDADAGEVSLGPVGAAASMISKSQGRIAPGGHLSIGDMTLADMAVVTTMFTGCNNGVSHTLRATFYRTNSNTALGQTIEAQVISSRGSFDEADEPFSSFVTYYADVNSVSRTISLSMNLDFQSFAPTCNTGLQYSLVVDSPAGDFVLRDDLDPGDGDEVTIVTAAAQDFVRSELDDVQTSLQQQLATAQATQLSLQTSLSAALSRIQSLEATVQTLSAVQENITGCHEMGMVSNGFGQCIHAGTTCPSQANLLFDGEAVAGTRAIIRCNSGFYDTSSGTVCQRDGTWTTIAPQCVRCDSRCTTCTTTTTCTQCNNPAFPNLIHGMCTGNDGTQSNPLQHCSHGAAQGFPNGYYYLNSSTGRVYRAYCLNEAGLGWSDVHGGGWEIASVQQGGNNLPVSGGSLRPNNELRSTSNNTNAEAVRPVILSDRSTHAARMGYNWHERGRENGLEWVKFMAKIYNDNIAGKDVKLLKFSAGANFGWFFSTTSRGCVDLPAGQSVELLINGISVGNTSVAVIETYGSGTIGLANSAHDPCNQPVTNRITTIGVNHGFRRISDASTDNAVRHLISYQDGARGTNSARCGYCCWGCAGWREVQMWAVRKRL